MAKKEFPPNEEPQIDFSRLDPGLDSGGEMKPKTRIFIDRVLSVFKLLLGLTLLTFVYSATVGFRAEFLKVLPATQSQFWSGVATFLILYLFIYEPAVIYQKGQKLLALVFKFFAPLVRVAPYVLPIYTIFIFSLYPVVKIIAGPGRDISSYFIFAAGFTFALHLVFSAKSLRNRQGDFLKANYIFGFSLVYILNLLLIALCLSLVVEKFDFVSFFSASFEDAKRIFTIVFRQIFVP